MSSAPIGPFQQSIDVTIDVNQVGPMLESKSDAIMKALADKMDYTSARLQMIIVNDKLQGQLLRHVTGKLGDSVRGIPTTVTSAEIDGGVTAGGGPVVYARALEFGSAAHMIVAVNAKALHFFVNGKEMFRRSVMHPGTRAYAFMRGTLAEEASNIQQGFQDAASEAASS